MSDLRALPDLELAALVAALFECNIVAHNNAPGPLPAFFAAVPRAAVKEVLMRRAPGRPLVDRLFPADAALPAEFVNDARAMIALAAAHLDELGFPKASGLLRARACAEIRADAETMPTEPGRLH